jgi:Zn-dependent peptidase ImmA (M78 family)
LLENKPDLGVLFRQPIGAESDPIEKEANCFAANMLVPKHRLNPWDRWQKESVVAQLFGVSEEVVRYRFKDLDRG